jgi:hypothetical protein
MSDGPVKKGYAAIADLGGKIGIPNLAMQDSDLVFADAHGVDRHCDQFETIDLTPPERFHFLQLIVASLDCALRQNVPGSKLSEHRVEKLLLRDLAEYKYIIDYWGRADSELNTVPMMQRLKRDSRYIYRGGEAPFE